MICRTLLFSSLLIAGPLLAQHGDRAEIDQSRVPPEWDIPPAEVLTPEEALDSFTLQPGFRIELVASEPLIQAPVALDFDEDGRIWVIEMQSFMPNVDGEGEIAPVSRVVVLEDTDGDGRMDKSTTYMDNLILPRAIRVVAGGVLVGEPPNLWFTRDTDGDLKADEKVLVTDQFSHLEANPEHGANGLLIGFDNAIHNAMYDGGIFRLVDGEWVNQPARRRGQWGISHDDYGRHFTNSNSDYLRADLVPNHYPARNENLAQSAGVYHRVDSNQKVWPGRITPGVNRRAHLDDDGYLARFTAACAPIIYRGDRYPEEFRGNAFVAEPAAHFIRRSIIREDEQGILTGSNAYEDEEFLYSTDERFRPVNLYNAPDGTIYVVDMYRGILQHRQFVTTYLRRQIIERGLEQPLSLGRIYRIVHESAEPGEAPKLSTASSAELVEHLSHPNGWWRDTAQRLLVERKDPSLVPALKTTALESENELARIHALWTLEGMNALDPELLLTAMDDASTQARATAVRVSEFFLRNGAPAKLVGKVAALGNDDEAIVRRQVALSLGELPASTEKQNILLAFLQRHAGEPYIVESVASGLANQELEMIEKIANAPAWRKEQSGYAKTLALFAENVMREGVPDRINRLLELSLNEGQEAWQNLALLKGVETSKVTKLTQRPAALDLQPADPKLAERASVVLAKLEWPKTTDSAPELSEELLTLAAKGASQYQLNCSACHQANGEGLEGLAKPLAGSKWVLGDEQKLVRIILHGKDGDMALMPPMGSLPDETIAAILSHIRRSWGNEADFVLPETVTEVRQKAERTQPWTEAELEALKTD